MRCAKHGNERCLPCLANNQTKTLTVTLTAVTLKKALKEANLDLAPYSMEKLLEALNLLDGELVHDRRNEFRK